MERTFSVKKELSMTTVSSSSKILDIKAYLDENNIAYNSRAKKAELLALAQGKTPEQAAAAGKASKPKSAKNLVHLKIQNMIKPQRH